MAPVDRYRGRDRGGQQADPGQQVEPEQQAEHYRRDGRQRVVRRHPSQQQPAAQPQQSGGDPADHRAADQVPDRQPDPGQQPHEGEQQPDVDQRQQRDCCDSQRQGSRPGAVQPEPVRGALRQRGHRHPGHHRRQHRRADRGQQQQVAQHRQHRIDRREPAAEHGADPGPDRPEPAQPGEHQPERRDQRGGHQQPATGQRRQIQQALVRADRDQLGVQSLVHTARKPDLQVGPVPQDQPGHSGADPDRGEHCEEGEVGGTAGQGATVEPAVAAPGPHRQRMNQSLPPAVRARHQAGPTPKANRSRYRHRPPRLCSYRPTDPTRNCAENWVRVSCAWSSAGPSSSCATVTCGW